MNTYLFCSFLFILSMKSSYGFSWFRNHQQPTKAFNTNIPSDELDVVFTENDEKKAKEELAKAKIEPIVNQNFTYMTAFVSKTSSEVLCQGALINPSWVLTSASCLKKYSVSLEALSVISGFHLPSVLVSELKSIVFHPEFQILTNLNDLALVELEPAVNELTPIALTNARDPKSARCDFTAIFNYTLIAFHVDLVSTKDCMRKEIPKQKLFYYCAGVNGRQIVLTQDDMLGVPLVCNDELYGIKSLTTVFTGVPDVYDWIMKTIKNSSHSSNITADDAPRYTSVMNSSEPSSQSESQKNEDGPVYTNTFVTESPDSDNTTELLYSV